MTTPDPTTHEFSAEPQNESDSVAAEDTQVSGAEMIAAVQLSMVSGIGPLTQRSLLERFGTALAVLKAPPSELRLVQGVGPQLSRAISTARRSDVIEEIKRCQANNIRIVHQQASDYPRMLREIHDPPGVIYVRGEMRPQDQLAIAVVGTRHATNYGRQQAERLSASLARAGLTIVSGLARGIDAAAHQGALSAGGRTIAVLASGVLNIYPPEHQELAESIVQNGALMSETSTLSKPRPGSFPRRNRLITGMSLGVIVVEAAPRSGALLTAMHATEQGREVFAVPGRVDSRLSRGCNRLIRDGAKLVESAEDVLEELGPLVEAAPQEDGRVVHRPAELQLNEQERLVLDAIDTDATNVEAIVVATQLPIHRVLSTISVLEMRKLVRRLSGTTVSRI
ncbi:MAG: DNA-processing protein DprA [Planctomycetales bacterium]|nr:DNA-processing protein DprA [Planctomycetales bacterium]